MKEVRWESERSHFGTMVDYGDALPVGANLVIICSNDGTGLRPVSLMLPHQVYKEMHGAIKGLTIIPAKSSEYMQISVESEAKA